MISCNKLGILFIFLLTFVWLGGGVVNTVYAKEPSLLFSPENVSLKTGEQFDLAVNVDTADQKVGGVGAKILFNHTSLQVEKITRGNIFNNYPSLAYDNLIGKIIISGVSSDLSDLYSGSGLVATVTFRAVSAGESQIQFIFEPDSTRDSNIAVTSGTGDILDKVNTTNVAIDGADYVVSAGDQTNNSTTGSFVLNSILIALGKLGITPETLQIIATRVMGKDVDTAAILLSQTSKTKITERQASENNRVYKSTKIPVENILIYLITTSLLVLPLVWVLYNYYKKHLRKSKNVFTIDPSFKK